jgi:transcriptional regulator with XRE-family HTH domain
MGFRIWQTNLMSIRDVLAGNFKKLKDATPALGTPALLVARGVLSNGTLGRIANSEVNLGIDHLEPLANAYGVEPWQLLDPDFYPPNEDSGSFFQLFDSAENLNGDLARATIEADDNVSQQRSWHKEIYEHYRAKSPPEAKEAPPSVNARIRPALTTASHLFELSKLLGQLDDDNKAVAAVILSNWAKKPESYSAVAAHLDLMVNAGNTSAETGRRQEFISSGKQG